MSERVSISELSGRLRRRGLIAFVVFGIATVIGAALDREQLFRSYLLAFLFWLAFPLGAFGIVQIHHITGGAWGLPVRRLLEGAARTLPLFALLFVPIAFGIHDLYEWSHEDALATDPILRHKEPWLNTPFFLGRAAFYFAVWITAMLVQDRLSARRDRVPDQRLMHRQRTIAAPALAAYALTMSFAAFDWAMSLEPHWFSSIYGLAFLIGQGLTAFAFAIVASAVLARREPFSRWVSAEHYHDLGKLMFACVLLWAYVGYSQFLLIWSANVLEEIPWYLARTRGGWQYVALFLITVHFALPFLILLSRKVKRNTNALVTVAALLLVMRWMDLAWNVIPAFHPGSLAFHWMDLTVTLALGGLWLAFLTQRLEGRPLITLQDAHMEGELERAPATVT